MFERWWVSTSSTTRIDRPARAARIARLLLGDLLMPCPVAYVVHQSGDRADLVCRTPGSSTVHVGEHRVVPTPDHQLGDSTTDLASTGDDCGGKPLDGRTQAHRHAVRTDV